MLLCIWFGQEVGDAGHVGGGDDVAQWGFLSAMSPQRQITHTHTHHLNISFWSFFVLVA